jgi:type II secretory pathway pseudopilin PulG
MTTQMKGRDAQRKADLKQVSNALELYFSDHGQYPNSIAFGAEFTDSKTVYFKVLPTDPSPNANYVYRLVPSSSNQKYQLFAKLENSQDQDKITTTYSCGGANCNYAVTSANTSATE